MTEPLVEELTDARPPGPVFRSVAHQPFAVWLDTAAVEPGDGHSWSFVATDPFAVLMRRGGETLLLEPGGSRRLSVSFADALEERLARWRIRDVGMPFPGGAAGFIGYEAARDFDGLPVGRFSDAPLPDVQLAFYDVVVGWHHATGRCRIVSTGWPAAGTERSTRARVRLEETLAWVTGTEPRTPLLDARYGLPLAGRSQAGGDPVRLPRRVLDARSGLYGTTSAAEYRRDVERIIEAIRAGDVYQVNLSQRFALDAEVPALALHQALRETSPAPYAAVVRSGPVTVVSSSPERFLRMDPAGTVSTRPIKGTRPRADDERDDARLANELRESAKDRAENLMIVDLLRNDLSRVCDPGSIRVPALLQLESWATVHHLVSEVTGRLAAGAGPADLLRATFPCGSVTGAPKRSAMQMIAALEPVARGPYCGAIGYFGFDGGLDLSVAIRIAVVQRDRVTFHGGGGVVYDSLPAEEYRETLAKTAGILSALRRLDTNAGGTAVPAAPTAPASEQ